MVHSRSKGRRGERQVRELIRRWWLTFEPGEFAVTPQSGGFSTAAVRGEFRIAGDLMTTAKRFPFAVEVKWREAWSMHNLECGRRSPVWGWWQQAQNAANVERSEPMLWFKHSRRPWFVMLRWDYATQVIGMPAPDIAWTRELTRAIDVGAMPVVYGAEKLLAVHPEHLANAAE